MSHNIIKSELPGNPMHSQTLECIMQRLPTSPFSVETVKRRIQLLRTINWLNTEHNNLKERCVFIFESCMSVL